MPAPGVQVIADSMSASWSWPWRAQPAIDLFLGQPPGGIWLLTRPSKITLIASPRIFGPDDGEGDADDREQR